MNADDVVAALEEYAELLRLDGEEGRSYAYDRAANAIRKRGYVPPDPSRLNGVGPSTRDVVVDLACGRVPDELQELREEYQWYRAFGQLDGVGPERAKKIHETFGIETIERLLLVGDDLSIVTGIGPATTEKILESAREHNED